LGRTYEKWRQQLLYARGELEALIDFSEDQHFDESPAELLSSVTSQVKTILSSIAQHEAASHRGELLKKGIRISLLGSPNAGKSSLLNHIVGREASIVSQEAGTTRDIVEVSLDIRGYLCTFADTAGLRATTKGGEAEIVIGAIEQEGIRRAKAKARESDIVIALASIERYSEQGEWTIRCDEEALRIAFEAPRFMIVLNKTDTSSSDVVSQLLRDFVRHVAEKHQREIEVIPISCWEASSNTTIEDPGNIHRLTNYLIGLFHDMTDMPTDLRDLLGVTERQRQLLSGCADSLLQFVDEAGSSDTSREPDIVVAAEHLRMAADSLARVTGRGEAGDVEEVLGVVFEKYVLPIEHFTCVRD
jgi:tRNA modification GTPase